MMMIMSVIVLVFRSKFQHPIARVPNMLLDAVLVIFVQVASTEGESLASRLRSLRG